MGKPALTYLARFCASQRSAFDLRAWLGQRTIDRRDLAIAALYLSMTSWYGYEGSLRRIAEELHPGIASGGVFSEEMSAADFDLARFSATTRYLILQARAGATTGGNRQNLEQSWSDPDFRPDFRFSGLRPLENERA